MGEYIGGEIIGWRHGGEQGARRVVLQVQMMVIGVSRCGRSRRTSENTHRLVWMKKENWEVASAFRCAWQLKWELVVSERRFPTRSEAYWRYDEAVCITKSDDDGTHNLGGNHSPRRTQCHTQR